MKIFPEEAQAAIEAGTATSHGAIYIACSPPVAIWGGYGDLTVGEGEDAIVFKGIGDRSLIKVTSGAIGGGDQGTAIELSGIEPDVAAILDATAIRRAPVVIYRLLFDASNTQLLAMLPFKRGRIGPISDTSVMGGPMTLRCDVEGAARGLGRSSGRIRSDADQKLNDPEDDGFATVSFAGQKTLYLGGRPPARATTALQATPVNLYDAMPWA